MNQFTVFDLYEISNATVLVSVQLVFKDIILHKIVYSLFYVKAGNFNVTCLKNCLLWKNHIIISPVSFRSIVI